MVKTSNCDMDPDSLKLEVKRLLIRELDLRGRTEADIDDAAPLFGTGLGLDSLDALQIAAALQERYGIEIPDGAEARSIFASVDAIAAHILAVTNLP
jgi:acyl carrier protein